MTKPYITSSLDELAQTFDDAAFRQSYIPRIKKIETGRAKPFDDARSKIVRSVYKSVASIIRNTELKPSIPSAMKMLSDIVTPIDYADDPLLENAIKAVRKWNAQQARSREFIETIHAYPVLNHDHKI